MALKATSVINTNIPVAVLKPLEPKLLWVWTNTETSCLWLEKNISFSEYNDPNWTPKVSEEFFEAVVNATDRLWIMDPHFDHKVGLSSIWLALTADGPKDVRVISHQSKPTEWIKKRQKKEPIKISIEWKLGFKELHDRFAIVDNEVWHFGSTVGGGYFGFGAVSRGWSAGDLAKLFLNRWEGLL